MPGQQVQTLFTFYIDSPPPLDVSLDDLNSVCGQVNVLSPTVSGGIGDYTYLWSTGETTPTISVSPGVTTDYSVTVNDVCGVAEVVENMTITLPIYPPLEITVSPETLIPCLGTGPIEVTSAVGGNDVFTYNWTANGAFIGNTATVDVPAGPPTWYIVTVGEGCGTSVQDSVLVGTEPLPPIVVTASEDVTVICPGDTTEVTVVDVTGGNGVYTYQWTNRNRFLSEHDRCVGGRRSVGCILYDHSGGPVWLRRRLPPWSPRCCPTMNRSCWTLPLDTIICAGDSADLFAEVSGGSGYYTILWHGPDSLSDPIQYVAPDEDTEYIVTVTDRAVPSARMTSWWPVEHVFTRHRGHQPGPGRLVPAGRNASLCPQHVGHG